MAFNLLAEVWDSSKGCCQTDGREECCKGRVGGLGLLLAESPGLRDAWPLQLDQEHTMGAEAFRKQAAQPQRSDMRKSDSTLLPNRPCDP